MKIEYQDELENDISQAGDMEHFISTDKGKMIIKIIQNKIREIDTVRGCRTQKELEGRQIAVKILNDILGEIYSIIDKGLEAGRLLNRK